MTADFDDQLAPFYHLLYPDWERSVEIQGRALDALLRELGVAPGAHVHDAAAGIGTQTLVLLLQGHALSASDTSPGAIQRLRHELTRSALAAHTTVDDLRQLGSVETGSKDAVIACDNSITHLFGDAKVLQSFGQCRRSLRQGGVVVFSVRDYTAIERKSTDVRPYGLRRDGDQRFLAVQVWEWQGDQYDLLPDHGRCFSVPHPSPPQPRLRGSHGAVAGTAQPGGLCRGDAPGRCVFSTRDPRQKAPLPLE